LPFNHGKEESNLDS